VSADLGAGFRCGPADERDGAFRAEVEVDPGSAWFTGHFPGDPVLPAIGQLDLLRRLQLRRGAPAHLAAVDSLRLAEPVRPGDRLVVEIGRPAPDGRSAVSIARGESEPVSRGTVRWQGAASGGAGGGDGVRSGAGLDGPPRTGVAGSLAPGSTAGEDATPAPPAADPARPSLRLPHAPPARFAEEVLEAVADRVVCRGAVPADHPSVAGGRAPALAAIELAAQSAAGLGAGDSVPDAAYLVRLRSVRLPLPTLPAATPLTARVRRDARHGPLTLLAFAVALPGGRLVAEGTLGIYTPEG